jgi:hypothetical protein
VNPKCFCPVFANFPASDDCIFRTAGKNGKRPPSAFITVGFVAWTKDARQEDYVVTHEDVRALSGQRIA